MKLKKMRMKKICVALASVMAAGVASQASALNLNQFDVNTINVFTTGSTALDGAIDSYMRYICTAGSLDQYKATVTQTAPAGNNVYASTSVTQSVYFCTIDGTKVTDVSLGGKKLLLRKSAGDSGEGVVAPGGAITVNFAANPAVSGTSVTNYTCPATPGTTISASGSLGALNIYGCTAFGTTTNTSGNGVAGFSDVEPALLNSILTPAVTAANLSNMSASTFSIAANIWGVPVTKALRNALQAVQSKTVGDESEVQMPSLPSSVLSGIYTGNINSWNFLTDGSNTPIATAAGVIPPADTNIYLVRRPDSSGTMTSFKVMFLNYPCANTAAFADVAGTPCNTSGSGLVVSKGQGTGNLLSCLGALNTANKWGIGLTGSNGNPCGAGNTSCTSDAGWRFIKVNGYAPTLFNAATAKYPYFTEATLQWQGSGTLAPGGTALAMLTEMSKQLANPTVLSAVNSGAAAQTYASPNIWYAGVMTPASNFSFSPTYPLNVGSVNSNPVLTATRAPLSANSCQPPVQFGLNIPVNTF